MTVVVLLAGCAATATPSPSAIPAARTEKAVPSTAAASPAVTATPTPVQSVTPSAPPVPSASPSATGTPELVHVTGQTLRHGITCTPGRCRFDGAFATSEGRLPGCYLFQTAGGTGTGTWGTVALASEYVSGFFDWGPFKATVTWRGEWFTAGPRLSAMEDSDFSQSTLWPVDAIWLHGLGEHKGLSAVLRIGDTGQIDGWLFPTPPQP